MMGLSGLSGLSSLSGWFGSVLIGVRSIRANKTR